MNIHERSDNTFALEDAWPLLNHNILRPEGRRGRVQVPSTDRPARLFWCTCSHVNTIIYHFKHTFRQQ